MRRRIKKLEHAARSGLDSFALEDGSRFYFDPTSLEVFMHVMECATAQAKGKSFPEPPPTFKAIARAKDRQAALEAVCGTGAPLLLPYDRGALLERGELLPRSMVEGRELGEQLEDLSG